MNDFAGSSLPSLEYDEGSWSVSIEKNAAGNTESVIISTHAPLRLTGEGHDEVDALASLFLRYMENTIRIFIDWEIITFPADSARVYHAADGAELSSLEWGISTDRKATFYPGDDARFIKQIYDASTLVVATTLSDEENAIASFDVVGLEQAIAPLRDAGGFWRVSERADPFDDSVVTTLVVDSDDQIGGDYPALVLRYGGEGHEAYIVWGVDIGYDEPVDVRYRIGGQPSECDAWAISTDRQATFYGGDVRRLIRHLTESEQFLAGVTPFRSNPIVARFDLRGLPAIVGLLGYG